MFWQHKSTKMLQLNIVYLTRAESVFAFCGYMIDWSLSRNQLFSGFIFQGGVSDGLHLADFCGFPQNLDVIFNPGAIWVAVFYAIYFWNQGPSSKLKLLKD